MHDAVGEPLRGNEGKGQGCHRYLEELGAILLRSDGAGSPLRGGASSQGADAPDHVEIDDRTKDCNDHHGDADRVLVKAVRGPVQAGSSGEGAEPDGDAYSTDRDDGGARALEQDKCEAGQCDPPGTFSGVGC